MDRSYSQKDCWIWVKHSTVHLRAIQGAIRIHSGGKSHYDGLERRGEKKVRDSYKPIGMYIYLYNRRIKHSQATPIESSLVFGNYT